jgi:molybdenum cofactor biosynthesis enzyme MoaA
VRRLPDFANILFAGPCNRRCYYCIGETMPERVSVDNLDRFPPLGIDAFVDAVNQRGIQEIVFTGTVSDPQLYRHEAALLALLRERVTTGARYSVHTNGVLALRKMDVFNQYDRACISFPSFVAATYARHMGQGRVPDLAAIVERARIPVKVSCVLDEHNIGEVDDFLRRCRDIGVRRVVLRKLFNDERQWRILEATEPVRRYRGNPVYDLGGMEVTYWDFDATTSTSINLFADGTLGSSYLLTRTPELRAR